MANRHVKKGDEVAVLSGADKGKRGKIIAVNAKKQRAIVEGVHLIKKHVRKNQQQPQGAIVEREGTLHLSNLMRVAEYDARAAKASKQTE